MRANPNRSAQLSELASQLAARLPTHGGGERKTPAQLRAQQPPLQLPCSDRSAPQCQLRWSERSWPKMTAAMQRSWDGDEAPFGVRARVAQQRMAPRCPN